MRAKYLDMYLVKDLYQHHGKNLNLQIVTGEAGINRPIRIPEAHRPGITLAGYLKNYTNHRILIFGKLELEYLRDLNKKVRYQRLDQIFSESTPAVIVARRFRPPVEMLDICQKKEITLIRSSMPTMTLLTRLCYLLDEEFTKSTTFHGTLVEVFGVGVLIKGSSSIGKSEAALGLIERGHRLVSDDTVRVKKREGSYLEGFGAELTQYHMEIRGIGIINVAHLYGAVCVRESKIIDLVVELEIWNEQHFYDRFGMEEKQCDILGIKVPYHVLPVKPGRDVVLLLETIALNHRLKGMGYNSAKEFNSKLLEVIQAKSRKKNLSLKG